MGPEESDAVPVTLPQREPDSDTEVVVQVCDACHTCHEEVSDMLDFVTFEGNHELLRGVKLSTVMRGAGEVFKSSEGSSDTYRLSQQVDHLGYFISHNWCIPRGAKYLSLVFKFNLNSAVLTIVLCHILCLVTSICGWQPGFHASDADHPVSIFCRLFSVPAVLLGFFLGGKFADRHSPNVFLDKVCINQSTEESQRAGIEKLGAFLRSSNRMLALYSHVYLSKLWTVFEVAGFLTMHRAQDLDLLPVVLPCFFMLILLANWLYLSCHIFWRIADFPDSISHLVTQLGCFLYVLVIRQWTKHKAQIRLHLATFEVRRATCANEDDRPLVYNHIAILLKAAGHVSKTASVEEALDVFDLRVRKLMATQFYSLFGTYAFRYKEYILLSLTNLAPCLLDYLGEIGNGACWKEVLREHVFDPFWLFTGVTLWQMALEDGTSYGLDLEGWAEAVVMFLVVWGYGVIGTVTLYLTEYLGKRARTDDTLFYCCAATVSITTLLSWIILPQKLSKCPKVRSAAGCCWAFGAGDGPSSRPRRRRPSQQRPRQSPRQSKGRISEASWMSEASSGRSFRLRCSQLHSRLSLSRSMAWSTGLESQGSDLERHEGNGLDKGKGEETDFDEGECSEEREDENEDLEEEEEENEEEEEEEEENATQDAVEHSKAMTAVEKTWASGFAENLIQQAFRKPELVTGLLGGGEQVDEALTHDLVDHASTKSSCSSECN